MTDAHLPSLWPDTMPDSAWRDGPRTAAITNHWLGGRDHYAQDREVTRRVTGLAPWLPDGARAARWWLSRTVKTLARQGEDQFIDLGCGLPDAAGNVHQFAQAPQAASAQGTSARDRARVLYVDNDLQTLAYARALLAHGNNDVQVLDADLRRPGQIIDWAQLHQEFLDLQRPVVLVLSCVLHFICDSDHPQQILATLRDAVTPGSYLMLSQVAADEDETGQATRAAAAEYGAASGHCLTPRTTTEITALFDGWDLLRPPLRLQRLRLKGSPTSVLAGVARKP